MSKWAFELENKIFSIVEHKATPKLITKFPDIFFTTTTSNNAKPKYPTVYIHELPAVEQGMDLVGDTINAVLYTMQIDVYTNTSQSDAKRVITEIAMIFKELKFEITSMPEFQNESTVFRSTMRVRRMIGNGDIL